METMQRVLTKKTLAIFLYLVLIVQSEDESNNVYDTGTQHKTEFAEAKAVRYLLYDVNPGEGFNLRRDVYMRVANLVKFLNEDEPWVLVLPPWGRLYHWQRDIEQIRIPWKTFFDLDSLREHVPVIEFEDYLKVRGEKVIDEVYYLQGFKGGWTHWEEKLNITECLDSRSGGFHQDDSGRWRHWFFGYEEVYAEKFACLSYMGHAGFIKPFLMYNTTGRCVFLPRAETLIHGQFGEFSPLFWRARRSMVFAKHLRDIGDEFRAKYLQSTDEQDNTIIEDWTKMRRKHGEAKGGPYIAIHLRRKDYLWARKDELPSLKGAAKQVKTLLKKFDLLKVYVATDAPKEEYEEFKSYFKKAEIYRYEPTEEVLEKYKDGGIAIIDQWIAAHARYFTGSHVSTFSFRIQEEREILGFDPEMTFNRMCGDKDKECEQPTKWTIIYD